ncbi:MAG: glycosyltransferase [Erythrobacter sp.]|nr:glycosyltransferase [Erythrobacter sp.]
MKHVLVLSTLYPNAANPRFGTFVARSMESLAALGGWKVTVINPIGLPPLGLGALSERYRALGDLPECAKEGGVEVFRPRFTLIPKLGARRNAGAIAKAAMPVARAVHAAHPVDLVDAQFFFPDGPAAAALAKALEKPLTIKARGSDITYWGEVNYARDQMREAAQEARQLLAVSSALREELALTLGVARQAVTVHYTGLDRDRFRPLGHTQLRSQLGAKLGIPLSDTAPLLVGVGALVARKGHDLSIEALAELGDEHPEARLLVVGKGEEETALRALAAERGVADRVHFTGAVDHDLLPIILSAADVMVLPTSNEGLANAWVEALACGTPIVTCDVGGARELVTSDIAGRLVERKVASVAQGVREVLSAQTDPQKVAALAQRFDWKTHAEELARYYESLLA